MAADLSRTCIAMAFGLGLIAELVLFKRQLVRKRSSEVESGMGIHYRRPFRRETEIGSNNSL